MDPNELTKTAYVRSLMAKNRSQTTIDGYLWWLDDLTLWLDGLDITLAQQPDLEDYFGHLLRELSSASAAAAYRTLRAFYNWAAREEIITKSPMAGMQMPTVEDRLPEMVTDDELRALLKACVGKDFNSRRDTAIIRLWCEPGSPRRAEMAGIQLTYLDMRASVIDVLGKGNKWRKIPFGVNTGVALDRYLRVRATHKYASLPQLWLGMRGALTASGLREMMEHRCAQAGIRPINPHLLRHTSYHVWREMGGSEDDAEVLWGWSPGSRMGRVYGRSARRSRAERAARKMSIADRL